MNKIEIRTAALEEQDRIKQQLDDNIVHYLSGRVWSLEYSHTIYSENLKEFKNWANEHSPRQVLPVSDDKKHKIMESYSLVYLRYLQNTLTAMLLFRDHTNKVKREIAKNNPEFGVRYDQLAAEIFSGSTIPQFLKEFRSYLIHDGLFGFNFSSNFEDIRVVDGRVDGIDSKVSIKVDDLRRSSVWSKSSLELLSAIESGFTIQQLFEDYNSLLEKFYRKFDELFQSMFSKELGEVGVLIDRFNELVGIVDETING